MYKTPRHKQNERLIIQCWADEEKATNDLEGLKRGLYHAFGALFIMCFLILMVKGCSKLAVADTIPIDAQAIRAVLGEAENQGYKGMLAVAEVIRHRGSLKGIYGYKGVETRYKAIPERYKAMAKLAWDNSLHTNITKGATHFENIKAFGKPKWAKTMVETVRIKDHVFYREG